MSRCSEDKPACRACRHLGLKCEYKRPIWWSDIEKRKAQKESIKDVIKATKMTEKSQVTEGGDSPPGLTHSLPTSANPDAHRFQRANSQDSYDSFDFNQPVHQQYDIYNPQVYTPQFDSHFDGHVPYQPEFSNAIPYEVDIKTERQMFVNDVQTRTDTSISTFSTFAPPNLHDPLASVPEENWLHEEIYDDPNDIFGDDEDFGMFDFSHAAAPPTHQASISVDEADRPLLEHFIDHVLPLTFPILDVNKPGLAWSEVILPALESNKTYLHCALTAAAVHMKFTQGLSAPPQLDSDIMRHRYATITELCESFKRNTEHGQILDATLALIFFQSATSNPDDSSPDIPWHQHFMGAADLIRRLDLANAIAQPPSMDDPLEPIQPPPFSMSLAGWIDILGATVSGTAPVFADAYRDAHLAGKPIGLGALMGCEDALMVMISEIACLDALKCDNTLSEVDLCNHITMLGQQMDLTEPAPGALIYPYTESGALRPRQLSRNISALYRKAARIWLQSLVPGASKSDVTMEGSLAAFAELIDLIPSGSTGYDRSLVWPVMIAGLQTTVGSPLRSKIEERWTAMGDSRDLGAFGRMIKLLREVWRRTDGKDAGAPGADLDVHWRDVMRECRLEFLPI